VVWHWHWHWHTGTKAAAILSPPPPVSLFPQSLSLFPSLRQLSCTCTTQRVPCVALPIAAFPASVPRPSSHQPSRPLLDPIRRPAPLPTGRLVVLCALVRTASRILLLLLAGCALLSHPSHPPARRALASQLQPVTAARGPWWPARPSRCGPLAAGSAVQPSVCPLLAFLARRRQRVQHPPLNLSRSVTKRACFSPFILPGLTQLQTAALVTRLVCPVRSCPVLLRAPQSAKQTPRLSPHKHPAKRS
jgi:hypothetical protein